MVSLLTESAMYYYFMKQTKNNYYEIVKRADYMNDYEMMSPLMNLIGYKETTVKGFSTRRVIYDLQSEDEIRLYKFQATSDDILLLRKSQFRISENE